MTYALEPDTAYVTCELLRKHERCQFSNTRHIVLDLARLCGKYPEKSVKDLRINPVVQRRTFSTTNKVLESDSDDSYADMPTLYDSSDSESEADSDTETAVPMDDDFLSIEDDDPTYCNICEIWVNGDHDHTHDFRTYNERCGLLGATFEWRRCNTRMTFANNKFLS